MAYRTYFPVHNDSFHFTQVSLCCNLTIYFVSNSVKNRLLVVCIVGTMCANTYQLAVGYTRDFVCKISYSICLFYLPYS
jgi:hypothetical protein